VLIKGPLVLLPGADAPGQVKLRPFTTKAFGTGGELCPGAGVPSPAPGPAYPNEKWKTTMTIAPEVPVQPAAELRFLSLEITGRCQLTCPSHCYAQAGPAQGHGTMTGDDWHRIIDEAAVLGTKTVQIIGGEPTLHPAFEDLVRHALGVGLRVRVYSNLYRVRAEHWMLYSEPGLSLATSYYSDDAGEHDRITGRAGSHRATRENIITAVRRRIPLRVGIVDRGQGQRAVQARDELLALGVQDVHVSRVRAVGNAAAAAVLPTTSELCGRCADGKAAILPDGRVAVCEIGRFLSAGSVKHESLTAVLASPEWRRIAVSIPRRPTGAAPCGPDCGPNDDGCQPSTGDTCNPADG
jgi:MoaA/NifB/PqqE/SkfB family radical SAM enzyme